MYQPKPADIALTQIHGPVGFGIRAAQFLLGDGFGDFEHALQYLGGGQIIEAEPGGARIVDIAEYDPRTLVWLRCPDQYREAVVAAARELEHTPYSFLDYDAIALHHFHVPAPGLQHYIADTGHMICSQLVDEAARRGGWQLFDDKRWSGFVVPGDIWGLIRRQDVATRPAPPPTRPVMPGMGT